MKLLIVINSLATGGAEKLLTETIPMFQKAALTVELALLDASEHPFFKELKKNSDVTIHELKGKSVYNPIHIFFLRKLIQKFDIVHVHLFPALYWVGFARLLSRAKAYFVFTEHNTTNRRKGLLFKWIDRLMYRQYHRIIAIAEPVRDSLIKKIPKLENRIVVIQNGIDIDSITSALPISREGFNLNDNHTILIQVSSFTDQKDQLTLIKSMRLLEDNIHLILVGEGAHKKSCMDWVEKLKLSHRVQFLGVRMDVPSLLKMSDIVVLSSYYEGLSLASIEGLASGRPLIASDAPGLSQVVKGAGLLFPIKDEVALAEAVKRLLEQPSLYDEISNKCLHRAQKYSLESMVNKHLALYQKLCRNQNS